jgi:hypothetical protein
MDVARYMRPGNEARSESYKQRQIELLRTTGFAGEHAEAAHQIVDALLRRGFKHTVAEYAGHLAASGSIWNFVGNPKIARFMRRSERTMRRARAELEAAGLIKSWCLAPGDTVEGQRAPVWRPRVVRDVSPLHRMVNVRSSQRAFAPHARSKPDGGVGSSSSPSGPAPASPARSAVAVVPEPAPMTAADFEELAARATDPALIALLHDHAAASRRNDNATARPAAPPVPPAPPVSRDAYVDALELDELEGEPPRVHPPPH